MDPPLPRLHVTEDDDPRPIEDAPDDAIAHDPRVCGIVAATSCPACAAGCRERDQPDPKPRKP